MVSFVSSTKTLDDFAVAANLVVRLEVVRAAESGPAASDLVRRQLERYVKEHQDEILSALDLDAWAVRLLAVTPVVCETRMIPAPTPAAPASLFFT